MPGPTLTADELADELGRSTDWLYDHWRDLVTRKQLPPPLHETVPLAWSRAQVHAFLDRGLNRDQQAAAAAYRAAAAAAEHARHTHRGTERVRRSRAQLDAQAAAWEGGEL